VRERQPAAAAGSSSGRSRRHRARHARLRHHAVGRPGRAPARGPAALVAVPVPAFDRIGNGGELFVHHEDARRGSPAGRPARPTRSATTSCGAARAHGQDALPGSPVGVVLARPSGSGSSRSRPTGR
jgi:hypothetical protein